MSDSTPDDREPIDIRDNPESEAGARDAVSAVARASAGGPPPTDAPRAGEEPERAGAGAGDPLAGVTAGEDGVDDTDDAVTPDTGPDRLQGRAPGPDRQD